MSVEFSNTSSIKNPSIIFDSEGMISVGNVIINGYFCSYTKGENVQCGKTLKPNDSCFSCMKQYNGVIITDYDCDYSSIIIPDEIKGEKVVEIGPFAFSQKKLTYVEISNNVKIIDRDAFSLNYLTSVTIPSSVKDIGITAFHHDDDTNLKLTTITNKTGIAFDWGDIINGESGYEFATGTVENDYGDVTIN